MCKLKPKFNLKTQKVKKELFTGINKSILENIIKEKLKDKLHITWKIVPNTLKQGKEYKKIYKFLNPLNNVPKSHANHFLSNIRC